MSRIKKIPANIAMLLIRLYQVAISPLCPGCCRFEPTCSQYAMTAIERFGFIRGGEMALKRIIRCRPGGGHGYDPVPEDREHNAGKTDET